MEDNSANRQRMSGNDSTVNIKPDITGETVPLKVGPETDFRIFYVHENILKSGTSTFFRAALKQDWKDLREDNQPIRLEHCEPETFTMYSQWLYTDLIVMQPSYGWSTLAKAYVLGEEVLDRGFQNAVMMYVLRVRIPPGYQAVNIAWDALPAGSPLRRVFVDLWATRFEPSDINKHLNHHYDDRFVKDVVVAVKQVVSLSEYRNINANVENAEEYLHKDCVVDTEMQDEASAQDEVQDEDFCDNLDQGALRLFD